MANIPKFCKIFIYPEDDFVRIPKDFEERYGRDLPIDLCLEAPDGLLWEVELLYSLTYELLIKKGWVEFRDHYSIEKGYFLVFKYNGHSRFHVHIFDRMGSEIKYGVTTSSSGADLGLNVPPRFHKILFGFELRIPQKFTETYGADLPDEVFLMVPGGKSSKVELTRNKDGEIWLGNGWEEFKDHHSISLGQTLVFQYDVISHEFEVWIFDMNAVEIDYTHVDTEETGSESQSFGGDSADVEARDIDKSTRFTLEIKVNNAYTIILPKDFTFANRIIKGMQVILQNVKGERWNVSVVGKDRRWGKTEQCGLSSGWNSFLVDNNVVVGTRMSFRMVSSSNRVIETLVEKNGPKPKELIKYVKRRGTMYEVVDALRSMKSLTIDESDESVSTETEVKRHTRRSRSNKKSGKKKK